MELTILSYALIVLVVILLIIISSQKRKITSFRNEIFDLSEEAEKCAGYNLKALQEKTRLEKRVADLQSTNSELNKRLQKVEVKETPRPKKSRKR